MFFGFETVGLYLQEQEKFDEGEADHGPMDLGYALGFPDLTVLSDLDAPRTEARRC